MNIDPVAIHRPGFGAGRFQCPADFITAVRGMDQNRLGKQPSTDPRPERIDHGNCIDVGSNMGDDIAGCGGITRHIHVVDPLTVFAPLQAIVPARRFSAVKELLKFARFESDPGQAAQEAKRVDRQVRRKRIRPQCIGPAPSQSDRRGAFPKQLVAAAVASEPLADADIALGAQPVQRLLGIRATKKQRPQHFLESDAMAAQMTEH